MLAWLIIETNYAFISELNPFVHSTLNQHCHLEFREIEPRRCWFCFQLCIKRKIYKRNLAYLIIEVKKSQNLLSSSWRLKNAHGVVPIWKPRGWRSRKYQCFSSMSPFKAVKREELPLTGRRVQLFCSSQAFHWLDGFHPH